MTSTRMRGCERARMRLISERRICDSDLFFARFTSHVCFSPRVAHCEPTCIWTLQSYRSAHARIGKSNRVRVLNALIVDVFAHVVSMLSTKGLSLSLSLSLPDCFFVSVVLPCIVMERTCRRQRRRIFFLLEPSVVN